ncbi:s-cell enriched with leucine-rich repeat-containing protein slra-related [Anaeramoeba flamelloides]|uniref:S-cell enriched with leucine-rich repeat-containing protein slra-related n=1 Tax=Anaeramoeba flamelloides TaxID=1746091 RepID=A0AAV7Z2F4_9EUKA|nr:s-cell enriched with leucine-rich repeat-containing protein slra-related [Anaeramoeba flamelloides]
MTTTTMSKNKLTITEKLRTRVDPKFLKEETIFQLSKQQTEVPDILLFDDVRSTRPELTGGKGSSLGILKCIKGVNVPSYLCVTTIAFNRMLNQTDLPQQIKKLDQLSELITSAKVDSKKAKTVEKEIYDLSESLRKRISELEFDEKLVNSIKGGYRKLCQLEKIEDLSVAVRSSATTEDLKEASFAGLHDTYLNQKGEKDVLNSVKKCWGSVFANSAVQYRISKKIPHSIAKVSVVIQKMVFPEVAGTGFTIEIGTTYPGIHVAATNGLGEGLVSGEVTSDEWLFNNENLILIKMTCGSKKIKYQILESGSGIEKVPINRNENRNGNNNNNENENENENENQKKEQNEDNSSTTKKKQFCLQITTARNIAKLTKRIGLVYKQLFGYQFIDTEFAISSSSTIYFVQARPVVPIIYDKILTVDTSQINSEQDILVKGKYSLLGSSIGKINVIKDFEELTLGKKVIHPEDIIVTTKTSNYWNQYLTNLKGIVSMEGSHTAHPMLIGRERKIPCVIGCPNCIELLTPYQGQWVTLDGLNKCIYLGKKKLIEANEQTFFNQFAVVDIEEIQEEKDSLKFLFAFKRAIKDENEKIWVANPNHPLEKLLQELFGEGLKIRRKLVNGSRKLNNKLANGIILNNSFKIIDSKICDSYQPLDTVIRVFEKMDLEECMNFHQGYKNAVDEFLNNCKKFTLSLESWQKYVKGFIRLAGYMSLSFFFRTYLNIKVSKIANKLKISKFHFSNYSEILQKRIFEEDNHFREQILRISKIIIKFAKENQFDPLSIEISQINDEKIIKKIIELSQNFRITKHTNFCLQLPIKETFKKIIEQINFIGVEKLEHMKILTFEENLKKIKQYEDYFVEDVNFQHWLKLSIKARIQHCNMHHKKIRGQWIVKGALLQLAEKLSLKNKDDIFNLSVKELTNNFKNLNLNTRIIIAANCNCKKNNFLNDKKKKVLISAILPQLDQTISDKQFGWLNNISNQSLTIILDSLIGKNERETQQSLIKQKKHVEKEQEKEKQIKKENENEYKETKSNDCDNLPSTDQNYEILTNFYHSLNGENWSYQFNWLNTSVCFCDWYGIKCQDGCDSSDCQDCQIQEINLSENGLIGKINEDFINFTKLNKLDLSKNKGLKLSMNLGEMCAVTSLKLSNNDLIELPLSFQGYEILYNLDLSFNKFEYFPNILCTLSNLVSLLLSSNQIKTVPECLNSLESLHELYLDQNEIEALPQNYDKLSNLQILKLHNNKIKMLPRGIGDLTSLRELSLNNNLLKSIPSTIGYLKTLQNIDLYNNQLLTLPDEIGELTNINDLDFSSNKLSALPLSLKKLSKTRKIHLFNNSFTSVPPAIQEFKSLRNLNLDFNYLTTLPDWIGDLKDLNSLNFENNQLTTFPESMKNLTNLMHLKLANNKFSYIPEWFGNFEQLLELDLSDNLINKIPNSMNKLIYLSSLNFKNNLLVDLPDDLFINTELISQLTLSNNFFKKIPECIFQCQRLINLEMDNNEIEFISSSISKIVSLGSLSLNKNYIQAIPIEINKNAYLNYLFINENELSSFPEEIFISNSQLITLDLSSNNISNMDFVCNLPFIHNLYLSNNEIGEMPQCFSNISTLKTLSLHSNYLTSGVEYITNNKELEKLYLNDNLLTNLTNEIGKLIELSTITLNNNRLIEIPNSIGNLKKLVTLDLSYNYLKDLPATLNELINLQILILKKNEFQIFPPIIAQMDSLIELDLSKNNIDQIDLSFEKLVNLQKLNLNENFYSDETHLHNSFWGLTNLVELRFANNLLDQISDNLSKLINLEILDLSNNNLSTFPHCIYSLKKIQEINLQSNRIANKLDSSLSKLQNLQIFTISNNKLSGLIPIEIFQLQKIVYLDLSLNNFNGNFETANICNLQSLETLLLNDNQLSEFVTKDRYDNCLLPNLIEIDFSNNLIKSAVDDIIQYFMRYIDSLRLFHFSNNKLFGSINSQTMNGFKLLQIFDISSNHEITGQPPEFIDGYALEKIFLQSTKVSGPIPYSWSSITHLNEIDISDTMMSENFLPVFLDYDFKSWKRKSHNDPMLCPGFTGKNLKVDAKLSLKYTNYRYCVCDAGYFKGKYGQKCIQCEYGCDCIPGKFSNCYPSPNVTNPEKIIPCAEISNLGVCNLLIPKTNDPNSLPSSSSYDYGDVHNYGRYNNHDKQVGNYVYIGEDYGDGDGDDDYYSNFTCKNEFTGRLCSECNNNQNQTYFSLNQNCLLCRKSLSIMVPIIFFITLFLLIFLLIKIPGRMTGILQIILNFFQSESVFSTSNLELPSSIFKVVEFVYIFSTFDVQIFKCIKTTLNFNFFFGITLSFPIFSFALILLLYLFRILFIKKLKKKRLNKKNGGGVNKKKRERKIDAFELNQALLASEELTNSSDMAEISLHKGGKENKRGILINSENNDNDDNIGNINNKSSSSSNDNDNDNKNNNNDNNNNNNNKINNNNNLNNKNDNLNNSGSSSSSSIFDSDNEQEDYYKNISSTDEENKHGSVDNTDDETDNRDNSYLDNDNDNNKNSLANKSFQSWLYKCFYIFLFLLSVNYFPVSSWIFKVFGCSLKDENNIKYLNTVPYLQCEPYTKQYRILLSFAIIFTIVYIIGIPVIFLILVLKGRRWFNFEQLEILTGFLTGPFKSKYWWWFLIDFLRKLSISFSNSTIPFYSQNRSILIVFIFQFSIILQHAFMPYNGKFKNSASLLTLYSTFISYFSGIIMSFLDKSQYYNTIYTLNVLIKIKTILIYTIIFVLYCWVYRKKDK